MSRLLERIFELEEESSPMIKRVGAEFDREVGRIVQKYLKDCTEEERENMQNEIFGSMIPMKRAMFMGGFQVAVRLIFETMIIEPREGG